MDYNKVIIVGRVTAKPELKHTKAGDSVTSFSIATNRSWKNKEGVKQEEVEFHNCVAWRKTAELLNQYVEKGDLLMVDGFLKTRTWEAQDGSKRKSTDIMIENIQFGPKPKPEAKPAAAAVEEEEEVNIDDIPF